MITPNSMRDILQGVIHCAAERRPDVAEKVCTEVVQTSMT